MCGYRMDLERNMSVKSEALKWQEGPQVVHPGWLNSPAVGPEDIRVPFSHLKQCGETGQLLILRSAFCMNLEAN